MAKKPKTEEPEDVIDAPDTAPLRSPVKSKRSTVADCYREFVATQAEGNFPAWDELPMETQALYDSCALYVSVGNEPRTDFERTVARLLTEAK